MKNSFKKKLLSMLCVTALAAPVTFLAACGGSKSRGGHEGGDQGGDQGYNQDNTGGDNHNNPVTVSTAERVENLINDLISLVPTEGAPEWWDEVIANGAEKFLDALTAANKGNLSNTEVVALLTLIENFQFDINNPFGLATQFYNTGISNTKISKTIFYLVESIDEIMDLARVEGYVPNAAFNAYQEIVKLGEAQFVTVFNALLKLTQLAPSLYEVGETMATMGRAPTRNEFKDIFLSLHADITEAVKILDPSVFSVITNVAKVFIPIMAVNDVEASANSGVMPANSGDWEITQPRGPSHSVQSLFLQADLMIASLTEFELAYPVLHGSVLAILGTIDEAMINSIYDLTAFSNNRMTEAQTEAFMIDVYGKMFQAIKNADLGTGDYAIIFKAAIAFGEAYFGSTVTIVDVVNSVGGFSNITLADIQGLVSDLQPELVNALKAIDGTTMQAVANIFARFLPVFSDDAGEFDGAIAELVGTYTRTMNMVIAMAEAVDETMVRVVYETSTGANQSEDYIVVAGKLLHAAFTSGEMTNAQAIDATRFVFDLIQMPSDFESNMFDTMGFANLTAFVNALYADAAALNALTIQPTTGIMLNASFNNNIVVQLLRGMSGN